MKYQLESFINFCNEMQIAEEGYTVKEEYGDYYVETNVNKIKIVITERYNYTDDPKGYNKRLNDAMTKVVKVVKSTYKDILDIVPSYLKFKGIYYFLQYGKIQDYKKFHPKFRMKIDTSLEMIEDGLIPLVFKFDRSMDDKLGFDVSKQGYGLSYYMKNSAAGWHSYETDSPDFKTFKKDPDKYIDNLLSKSTVSYEDLYKNFVKDFKNLMKEYNIQPGLKTYQIPNEINEDYPVIVFKEYDEDYSETGGDYDNGLTKKDKNNSDKCVKTIYAIYNKLKNKYTLDIDVYRGHGTIYLKK